MPAESGRRAAAAAAAVLMLSLRALIPGAAAQQCAYPGCPAGTQCTASNASLCSSHRCAIHSIANPVLECLAATCADNLQNAYETGYDCGGGCVGCLDGSGCYIGQDCASGVCGNDAIDPTVRCLTGTCFDSVQNGAEPDIDCGVGCCQQYTDAPATCPHLCRAGMQCVSSADCASGQCYRLPRLGGMRFCAGTRPTTIDTSLTTRLMGALRLEGQRRAFFNASALRAALAFMLDVEPYAILVEAVTDVSLPQEWGMYAYLDIIDYNAEHVQGARRLHDGSGASAGVEGTMPHPQPRRSQVVPPSGVYYISTTDTAEAVEMLISVFVQPGEAWLILDRLKAAVNGTLEVLPGGWLAERVLARQQAEVQSNVQYCTTLVNASTAWDLNTTVVNCYEYANLTVWAQETVTAAAAVGNHTVITAPDTLVDLRRTLGSGQEAAYAAAYNGSGTPGAPMYTLGMSTSAMPRVSLMDLIGPITPGFAWPPRIALSGNATYDTGYDAPSNDMVPTELLVTTPMRGVPGRPLYNTLPFAQQPVATLVDRHDRPITSIVAAVSVLASLDERVFPLATSSEFLFGDVSQALSPAGTADYKRLRVAVNASQLCLWFTATWLTADGVAHAVNVSSAPTDILLKPVPVVVIIPRVPFSAIAVAVMTVAALAGLAALWLYCVRRRQRRMAAAKILDVTLVVDAEIAVGRGPRRRGGNFSSSSSSLQGVGLGKGSSSGEDGAPAAGAVYTETPRDTAGARGAPCTDLVPYAGAVGAAIPSIYGTSFGFGFPLPQHVRADDSSAWPATAATDASEDPLPMLPAGCMPVSVQRQPPRPTAAKLPALLPSGAGSQGDTGVLMMVAIPHSHADAGVPCHIVPVRSLSPAAASGTRASALLLRGVSPIELGPAAGVASVAASSAGSLLLTSAAAVLGGGQGPGERFQAAAQAQLPGMLEPSVHASLALAGMDARFAGLDDA